VPSAATIPALIQAEAVDIAGWPGDFAVYPQGAREKRSAFCPDPAPEPELRPGWRYLFKESDHRYPDQFWGEIVAYRVGCLVGLEVPPAFAAWNSSTGECAALIEWFYAEGRERLVLAGDDLQRLRPNFDRRRGSDHSMGDNVTLLRAYSHSGFLTTDWRAWWGNALAFDALIGNVDRHQDNWGFVWEGVGSPARRARLTPLFDNGTALGYERFPHLTNAWNDQRWEQYVSRGRHHVRWQHGDEQDRSHISHVRRAMQVWPQICPELRRRFAGLTSADLAESIHDLPNLMLPVRMTPERFALMLKLLGRRLSLLQQAIL